MPALFVVSSFSHCSLTVANMVKGDACMMFGRQKGGELSSTGCGGCRPARVTVVVWQWLP